ncbi:CHAT domain-containing protein [Xanthobacter autotrophicus]|uniref:CHAT domain-containing protein n=1 Tax=Xanthobacter TaxID=279 RepID=UPI0024AAEE3D|nr:CHAT domain-containing protein [Xanthobacter autotrophicus]MDI4665652.1 CHAT domain-containing protein [Xanthobacter autotrophicus]
MPGEPLRALEAALEDPIDQIRIGAARAAPWLAPHGAADLLRARQARLPEPLPVAEAAILAIALERAGADGVPLASRLLETTPERVVAAASGDGAHWVEAVNPLIAGITRRGPFRLIQPFYVAHRTRTATEPWIGGQPTAVEADPERRMAQEAQEAFRQARRDLTLFDASAAAAAGLDTAFRAPLDCLETAQIDGAVEHLLALAITAPDTTVRQTAQRMLPAFGPLAAGPLLTLLAGRSAISAGPDLMAAIEAERQGNRPPGVTAERLGAFLASEALEDFTDTPTAFAVIRAGLSWQGMAKARAQRVAARMSAHVALPPLAWSALQLPASAERGEATDLLLRILRRDEALGIRFHHIGPTEVTPDEMVWLGTLVRAGPDAHAWTEDPGAAIPILREAIVAVPDVAGDAGHTYKELGTSARLDNFIQSENRMRAGPDILSTPQDGAARSTAPLPASRGGSVFGRIAHSIGKVIRDSVFSTRMPDPQASRQRAGLPDVEGEATTTPDGAAPEGSVVARDRSPAPEAPTPAGTVMRHPLASFPARCTLGHAETLRVRLLVDAAASAGEAFPVPFAATQTETRLLVLVMAAAFEVSPAFQVLTVPRDADSAEVSFLLTPRTAGRQPIDIKFLLGTDVLGHCCVVTEVTEAHAALPPEATPAATGEAQTLVLEPLAREVAELRGAAHAVLQVKMQPDDYLKWTLLRRGDTPPESLGSSPSRFGPETAARLAADQGKYVRQTLENDLSPADLAAVLAQLAALGFELYRQIAPPSLAAALAALPDNAIVVIDSDADWVPWELLACRPDDTLWGDRFLLVRAPVATVPPNSVVAPPSSLPTTLNRAALIVGDGIDRPTRLGSRTFGDKADRASPPLIEQDWNDIAAACKGKDIIHFACHGRRDPGYYLSYKAGIGGRLYPAEVHRLGLKWGAVVFANACGSATADLLLAEFQSFGREFYFAGARPFIGTLGPVPEVEAVQFAGLFYEEFAGAGLPAGQAMRQAKQRAAQQFKKPIWLYYCLYGLASTRRAWTLDDG